MQLPPTILSLDKHGKKNKQAKPSEKQRKNDAESKGTSTEPPTPDKAVAHLSDSTEDNMTDSNPEIGTDSESEPVIEDIVIAEETVAPAVDEQKPSEPAKKKTLKRSGLRPPRTLETTLFDRLERMYGPGIKRLLNVQYRYAPADSHAR